MADPSGAALLDIAFATAGPYGWPDANTMHQPALEELIAARVAALAGITVLRGHEVVKIADDGERVEVTAATDDDATRVLSARWVVGCDGANSFVRDHLDVSVTDLGFSYEWLLCDVELHRPREFTPTNVQICDPARPTTVVASGPGRRRWEFMRLPGESTAELNRDETAWRLLAPFGVTPDTATCCAAPRTSSRPVGPTSGAWAVSCWPETRPISCRPSPGRACAPASGTSSTWHGSWT